MTRVFLIKSYLSSLALSQKDTKHIVKLSKRQQNNCNRKGPIIG